MDAEKKEDKRGVVVNPTSINVVCFSHFFCACIYLGCLQPCFRALRIVWVNSYTFIVRIVHRLIFWIPYSVINVLTKFENYSQPS